jgi:1-acyl-sn-glycerol-3-phosphate acyltransferase
MNLTQLPQEREAADCADRLMQIVSRLVAETRPGRRARVEPDSHLERELGLDSLARVELVLRLQQSFGVTLPEQALSDAQTPRDLLRLLLRSPAAATEVWNERAPLADAADTGVPEHARSLVEVLDWHADRHPERLHVALYEEGERLEQLGYGALREKARSVATGLAARGMSAGQMVALMLPTGVDYLACFYGVLMTGCVPVPIYPPARLSQIEEHLRRHARILANAEAVIIITVAQAKPVAMLLSGTVPSLRAIVTPEELLVPPGPIAARARSEDLAFLQYTSGSTGDPKGVMLTHGNLLANIRAMGQVGRVSAADVFVSWLPLYHDMGLIGAWFVPLYFGFPLVLMSPLAFLARPVRWLRAIHRHRGTISGAPNFAYELVARKTSEEELAGLDLASWRIAFNGAEPVSPTTMDAFSSRLAPYGLRRETITPVYGLAECSVCLAVPPLDRGPKIDVIDRASLVERLVARAAPRDAPEPMRIPACGRAIPGHAIRVVDEHGVELADRRVGRLQFSGPSATQGYYRNPEATRKLIDGQWRETGDYAYLAEGEVYLTGRVKDLIIRGGRNVYPYELEQAVGELPGVRKGCVAVFGATDPTNQTERLVVLVETRPLDEDARERLRQRIVELATDVIGMPPDDVVLAPQHTVLKTSSGKIRRAACREIYEKGAIGARTAPAWIQIARMSWAALRGRIRSWRSSLLAWGYGAWAWLVFTTLAVPTWALVAGLQRPRTAHFVMHWMSRLMLALVAVPFRVAVAGRLPAKPHVLVTNHGSYLDAVLLVAALPPALVYAYVAKSEFAEKWWTRLFFQGIGALMVERFDARRGSEGVDQIVEALRNGRSVVVFPEGTFTSQTGIRPFRMGAFVAATKVGAPLVSAGLRGARAMLRDKSWLPRWGHPELSIGAIVAPTGSEWADAVAAREAARSEIVRLSGEPDLDRNDG